MTNRFKPWISSDTSKQLHAALPLLLLFWAGCLEGAKTVPMFFLWATPILAIAFAQLLVRPADFHRLTRPHNLLLLACLITSLIFSYNRSVSLFPTLQIVIYLTAWVILRAPRPALSPNTFWRTLLGFALFTLAYTLIQVSRGRNSLGLFDAFGFLPFNPSFNAIWMASLAVAFICRISLRKRFWTVENVLELGLAAALTLFIIGNPARTRSAPLALVFGLSYVLYLRFGIRKVALGGMAALVLACLCLPKSFLDAHLRISGKYKEPNYRTSIWKAAAQSALDQPLTGYGLGNFEMGYQKHSFPVHSDFVRYARTTQFAHNELLQIAADGGLIAFALAIFLLFRLFRHSTTDNPDQQRPAKAALVVLCSDAFFNLTWHMPFLVFLFLMWSDRLLIEETHAVPETHRRRKTLVWTGALLIVIGLDVLLAYSAMRSIWAGEKNWTKILRWDASDAQAWNETGNTSADPRSALTAFTQAVQLAPNQFYFHESLAFALETSNFPTALDMALREHQIAFDLAPGRAIHALAIGRLIFNQGDVPSALPWFERAQELEPNYWEAYLWRARCLYQLGDRRQAIWTLRQLISDHDDFLIQEQKLIDTLTVYNPSGYERRILSYSAPVVRAELRRFRSN